MDRDEGILRHGMRVYWLSKLFELLDTVYMILRHRIRQISFLHVFHHSTITLLADWCYFISPFPAVVPVLALNSLIHVVMYGYYFLTALYPLHAFTWKKRITQMQITQFILALVHAVLGYMYHGFCLYSLLYGLSMLALFSNFYYVAFIKKKRSKGEGHRSKN
jgi:elongation of very long chain fatty acids protein 4